MKKLIIIFVTASVLGFIMESLFVYAASSHFRSSGNHGQYYQMYGFCAVGVYLAYKKLKLKPWQLFLLGISVVAIVEFCASFFLQYVLDHTAWSYCTEFSNIFCRTTVLRATLISGVTTIYIVFCVPLFLRFGRDRFFLYACYFIFGFILVESTIQVIETVFSLIQ